MATFKRDNLKEKVRMVQRLATLMKAQDRPMKGKLKRSVPIPMCRSTVQRRVKRVVRKTQI